MSRKSILVLLVVSTIILGTIGCDLFGKMGAPNKPATPTGPDMRGVGNIGTYTTKTTDPEGDSVSYQFNWGGSGDTSVWSSFVPSGDSVKMTHAWATAGTYSVTARARDNKGNVSDWSAALTVTVRVNQAPATPGMPTGPFSGVAGRTYYFSATTTDPDNDMVQFRFSWGDGDTSDWGAFVASGQADSAAHSWANGGFYQIAVQARDKLGGETDWSEPLGLVIGDTAYLYTIALSWDAQPRDLDAHIWTPAIEGDSWHIYFSRKGHLNIAPYCSLDVDDVTSYGPEHITIKRAFTGEYIYAVHNWSGDADITTSEAVVRIYNYGNLIQTFTIPTQPVQNKLWWHVFKLNAETGQVTVLNTLEDNPPLPWTDQDTRRK